MTSGSSKGPRSVYRPWSYTATGVAPLSVDGLVNLLPHTPPFSPLVSLDPYPSPSANRSRVGLCVTTRGKGKGSVLYLESPVRSQSPVQVPEVEDEGDGDLRDGTCVSRGLCPGAG